MSFNLSYFIDFSPAVSTATPAQAAAIDTQAILDAIARINVAPAAAVPAAAERDPQAEAALQSRLAQLSQNHGASVKKPRQLRPAVSSKDNKVEKSEQPLRVVHRKIEAEQGDDSLSKQVVEEMAQIIAGKK